MNNKTLVLLGLPGQVPSTSATFEAHENRYVLGPEECIEEPQQAKVNRTGNIVDSIDLGDRHGVVADYKPRVLWGLLDGRPFSVLDARMSIEMKFSLAWPEQVYEATYILWDAHIRSFDSQAEAVRIALSVRWAGWSIEDSTTIQEGKLGAWSDDDYPGLMWEPTQSSSVYALAQRFPPLITTLFQLWTEKTTAVRSVEIRINGVGWCRLKSSADLGTMPSQPLLDLNKLTLEVVAKWLALAKTLGPVPFMAVQTGAPLQSDAQMVATALEGLHRRLHPDAIRFRAPVSKKLLDRARRAASQAAVEVLAHAVDRAESKAAYDEALGHMGELSYSARIEALLPVVDAVAPGLIGPSRAAWIKDMKDLRNIQSHGLQKHDDFDDAEVGLYYVLASSGRWVLKILLLLELVDEKELRLALRQSNRFMYSLANMDRENFWPEFSAYETFVQAS